MRCQTCGQIRKGWCSLTIRMIMKKCAGDIWIGFTLITACLVGGVLVGVWLVKACGI